jgi:hypothetical protein
MDGDTVWTRAEVDEATATGRVPACWWCGVPIVRDRHGEWIHTSRTYMCRDGIWGWLPHYAQPHPIRRVLPRTGRRSI